MGEGGPSNPSRSHTSFRPGNQLTLSRLSVDSAVASAPSQRKTCLPRRPFKTKHLWYLLQGVRPVRTLHRGRVHQGAVSQNVQDCKAFYSDASANPFHLLDR